MVKVKGYPLEIQDMIDDSGDACAYYAKGHHAPAEFAAACDRYAEEYGDAPVSEEQVSHEWLRCIPVAPWEHRPYDYRLDHAEPHSRGAFPATVVYP